MLEEGKLRYDYMGSSEFEFGDQTKSLKRIFATGIELGQLAVVVEGHEVLVYVVAIKGFPFADYQPHLQELVEGNVRLKERSGFDYAAKEQAGIPLDWRPYKGTKVWFDFPNNVLWALEEKDRQMLLGALEKIKEKWS
jgi:hypothetical protein